MVPTFCAELDPVLVLLGSANAGDGDLPLPRAGEGGGEPKRESSFSLRPKCSSSMIWIYVLGESKVCVRQLIWQGTFDDKGELNASRDVQDDQQISVMMVVANQERFGAAKLFLHGSPNPRV
jgi:hypothetical protein